MHFRDKDDVIIKYFEYQIRIWKDDLDKQKPSDINIVESLFIYFKSQEHVLKLLYKDNLSYLMLKSLYNISGPKEYESNITAYWNACLVGGLFMWCDEWVKRGMQESPKEMANLIAELKNKDIVKRHPFNQDAFFR